MWSMYVPVIVRLCSGECTCVRSASSDSDWRKPRHLKPSVTLFTHLYNCNATNYKSFMLMFSLEVKTASFSQQNYTAVLPNSERKERSCRGREEGRETWECDIRKN